MALTPDDPLNAVVALAARRELRVPLAIAVIGNPARAEALAGLGVRVICPTTRAARELHQTLVRSGVESELLLAARPASTAPTSPRGSAAGPSASSSGPAS